jgi:ribosomal protein L3 glutamine methyltransferase
MHSSTNNFSKINAEQVIVELVTILDYIRWAASLFVQAELFFGHGTNNARDEATALILHSLHQPYDLPLEYFSSALTKTERQGLVAIIERRIIERKPLAYLINEIHFAGLLFYVDERVLVPRSPIAELIEQQFDPWLVADQVSAVLDLCTGSACIACACAYAFADAQVDAIDISADALAVAAINREQHQLQEQVNLIESDLFTGVNKRYDLIVSNPPYVSEQELNQLPDEYRAEPRIGFAGGDTGLDIVIRILAEAEQYLNEQGILVVEVGSSAETLQNTFTEVPFYWLEFERGGDGVFLLTAEQVRKHTELFKIALN